MISAPLCTEFKLRARKKSGGLGHEAAGEVVEIGPKVRSVAVGDRVVVMPQNACGICPCCTSGEHIYCQSERKVDPVGAYNPSYYGFSNKSTGKRPQEFFAR